MKQFGLIVCVLMVLLSNAISAQQVASLAMGDFNVPDNYESSTLSDELVTALVETRKFNVTEFSQLDELLRLNGQNAKTFINRKSTEDNLLDKSNIDYLLQGSVRTLNNGSSKVNVELVKISRDGESLINTDGLLSATFKPVTYLSEEEQAASMIRDLVVASLFPIRVIATTDEKEVMLNYGQGLLDIGDVLQIPNDAEKLEQQSLPMKLEVMRVGKKFAYAKVLEGGVALTAGTVLRVSDDRLEMVNATDSTIQTLY